IGRPLGPYRQLAPGRGRLSTTPGNCANFPRQQSSLPGSFFSPVDPHLLSARAAPRGGLMHIDQEIKLDFTDVLIRPKRSTLTSRSEVDISRNFVFRHSGAKYHGIPIIAA